MSDPGTDRLFDKLDKVDANVSAMGAKLDAHMARTDERLEHGSKKFDDLEQRMRGVERAVPLDVRERLERLEGERQRRVGKADVITVIGSLASGSAASAVISWALSRH